MDRDRKPGVPQRLCHLREVGRLKAVQGLEGDADFRIDPFTQDQGQVLVPEQGEGDVELHFFQDFLHAAAHPMEVECVYHRGVLFTTGKCAVCSGRSGRGPFRAGLSFAFNLFRLYE